MVLPNHLLYIYLLLLKNFYMKIYFLIAVALAAVSCNTAQTAAKAKKTNTDYANTITSEELKTHLYTFASDEMQGRMTGTEGQKMAANYLKDFYTAQGIKAPENETDYFQEIPVRHVR